MTTLEIAIIVVCAVIFVGCAVIATAIVYGIYEDAKREEERKKNDHFPR